MYNHPCLVLGGLLTMGSWLSLSWACFIVGCALLQAARRGAVTGAALTAQP